MALSSSLHRRAALWTGSAALAIVPWLLDVGGHGLPRRLTQFLVAAGIVGVLLLCAAAGRRAFARELRASRLGAVAILALLTFSVGAHFVGLAFEVGHGYYRDEGIYRAAAERIDAGALLPTSFIYGHLPYYLAAWSLWFHRLFLAPTTWIVTLLTGLADESAVSWMWIRLWSGLCGAMTVLPVFGIARRVVDGVSGAADTAPADRRLGLWAGLLGGALICVSTLYNEVTHVFISDVPAAFFAALCMYFVARLAGREAPVDYLWAGVSSGLAAGCKYPAGVVALAIACVWAWWRWRQRRAGWGIALAAGASLGTFLLVMPSFFVHAGSAFSGQGRDVFFGVRQYAEAGWIGVEKDSNAHWYAAQLADSFGLGAILLGLAGAAWLPGPSRRRWLAVASFPLFYGVLLIAMSMVVKRNLLPFLPVAAALLGAGGAGAVRALGGWLERWPRARAASTAAVALAMLALPGVAVVEQDLSLSLPGTREATVEWIHTHLPAGVGIVKESYTPNLGPEYDVLQSRFAARVEPQDLWSGRYDFVLLADSAYGRFLDPQNLRKEHQKIYAERYRELLALPEVFVIDGGRTRLGPGLSLRRLERGAAPAWTAKTFAPVDAAALARPAMRPAGTGALEFAVGDFALFKGRFAAGSYALTLSGESLQGGSVRVVSDAVADLAACSAGASCRFELAQPAKVFVTITLPAGARLAAVRVDPATH